MVRSNINISLETIPNIFKCCTVSFFHWNSYFGGSNISVGITYEFAMGSDVHIFYPVRKTTKYIRKYWERSVKRNPNLNFCYIIKNWSKFSIHLVQISLKICCSGSEHPLVRSKTFCWSIQVSLRTSPH